jgi:hypothetical protein
MGSKNHEVVPVSLVASIAQLRHGGVYKCCGELSRLNLISRVKNVKCMHQKERERERERDRRDVPVFLLGISENTYLARPGKRNLG